MDAVRIVEDEVRELIRRRGLDPTHQGAEVRRLVEAAVHDYDERSLVGKLPPIGHLEQARRHVYDAVAGYGDSSRQNHHAELPGSKHWTARARRHR